jgi:hypothetical protein
MTDTTPRIVWVLPAHRRRNRAVLARLISASDMPRVRAAYIEHRRRGLDATVARAAMTPLLARLGELWEFPPETQP